MQRTSLGDRFLGFHSWVLVGYSLMGRGFSYVGLPPLFIGEISLIFGFVSILFNRSTNTFLDKILPAVLQLLPAKILVVFMAWCLVCTIPHVPKYGIDSVRDAAIWYYGFFALIIATLIAARPQRLLQILDRYRQFVTLFLIACPIFFLISESQIAPKLPGAPVAMVELKAADLMMHLSGVTAFFVAMKIQNIALFIGSFLLNLVVVVTQANRSGTLAFLCSFLIVTTFRPQSNRIWSIMGTLLLGGILVVAIHPEFVTPVINKMLTIFVDDGAERYQGTKEFRIRWWNYIISYTFGGEHFWMGKGFGVNLGLDDRFDPLGDGKVRSPHNGHLCVLARSGVPGFFMWVALQSSWAIGVLTRLLRSAMTQGQSLWRGIFLFLFCYWVAFMVTINFEVVLEGPTGGIWLWSLLGLGIASMYVYDHQAEFAQSSTPDAIENLNQPTPIPASAGSPDLADPDASVLSQY
jgi:O-Antigen ligase